MAKDYRYADAVRLLGGADPAVEKIDLWLGIGTLGLWDVIDAKQQFVQVGDALLGRWREWRSGRDWHSRTERIEAAHTILVITAFFEALDVLELPFGAADLRMSKEDQAGLARRSGLDLAQGLACPSPHLPFEQAKRVVFEFYEDYAGCLRSFVTGLSIWDGLRRPEREQVIIQFDRALPEAALRRYEDRYRNLALDVPEFAFWASMIEHQATRAGLAELERLLSLVTAGAALPDQLVTLSRLHRAALREPLAATGAPEDPAGAGLRLPSVEEAYVTPRFRVGEVRHSVNPSVEAWWENLEVREDLPRFLAGFLTQSTASQVPFVILGQPGAGKSLLTKVLAARLPEGRFLPIRVPLQGVAANADIQEQIERAVFGLSGERVEWPALARGAGGVLPVVLLDGFDELLQATGVRQSDYLERVARFQRREADAGRAVAVIVTSRTAVADRAAFVPGTVVARLEPFDEAQIGQWLTVWNDRNDAYFTGHRVRPLALPVALAQRALAEQPLLLLMLALYDADGNALSAEASGEGVAEFGQAELYERLVRRFVERELEKAYPDDQVPALLEREMLHLSYVAFAMFNRGRQWVTTAELDHDLAGLEFPAQLRTGTFATPLTAGELAIAKFFFVHRARATRDDDVVRTYEFLHATFGEYLIARLITALLGDLAVKESGLVVTEVDDGLLRTLLSWSALSSRTTIVHFLRELGTGDPGRGLALRLLRRLDTRLGVPYPNYRPRTAGPARRHAYYSANLLVIALAHTPVLRAGSFLPGEEDTLAEWRSQTLLWRSQCAAGEWASLINLVQADVVSPEDGGWDVELRIASNGWTPPAQLDSTGDPATGTREIWEGMFAPPAGTAPDDRVPEPVSLLLDRIATVCETRHEHAETRRVAADLPHLLVTVREDGFTRRYLIGAHVGRVTEPDVEAFLRHVHAAVPGPGSELVYQGPAPGRRVQDHALRRGLRLRSFVEFQGLLDLSGYVATQTARLRSDRRYLPDLYVPQRFLQLDRPGEGIREDLTGELIRLLAADRGCFTLVLGDFGRGKTFALHEVARRIPDELPALTPMLIELRSLDNAHSVNGLVAAHLANRGEELIDLRAFRYLLRQGRIALLFDGFDELVSRVTYDRAADHLETLLRAAEDKAKIMVTARTQHFQSERQVLTALGERVGMLTQRRVLSVEDFTPAQVRTYLVNRYGDEQAAADRFALLRGISDLLGLAQNPRMLSFIADLPDERLRAVATAGNAISPALLYEEILTSWLMFEENRTSRIPGTPGALTGGELRHATATLALRLWTTGESSLGPAELAEVAEALAGLTDGRLTASQTAHAVGAGSLLVRTEDGRFGFIHSSIAEWLVASEIAAKLAPAGGRASSAAYLTMRPLSTLAVEFLCDLADLRLLAEWTSGVLADSNADHVSRSNALRITARLRTPAGADLRGARLSGHDLSYRDLSGVDLTGADLTGAQLVAANLTGAVLRDARLIGARLDEAVLTGADLRGTDLTRAWLARADLRGIRTEGSRWDRAALIHVTTSPSQDLDPALRDAVIVPGTPVSVEVAPAAVGVQYGYQRSDRLPEPIAYHPGGAVFAVGGEDGGVLICDSATGLPVRTLRGHRGPVTKIAYAAGALVTAAADGTVRLWDPATGDASRVLSVGSEDVWPVVVSPMGDLAMAGDAAGVAHVWSTRTGAEVATLPGHAAPIHAAAFAGDLLVTADDAGAVRVWDPAAAEERRRLTGHHGVVRLTASPDGRVVAAGDSAGLILLWDPRDGTVLREFRGHDAAVATLAFDPTGRLLASGDWAGAVRVWDTVDGVAHAAPRGHDVAVYHVLFSPDCELLATGDSGGLVRILHPETGERLTELADHRGAVWSFAFHPDGRRLATSGNDGTTRLWDPRTGWCQHVLRGHGRRVTATQFSADGTMLAACGNDGTVRLWDPRTCRQLRTLTGTAERLVSAVFSPVDATLATAGSYGAVYLWDAATGGLARELNVDSDSVWAGAFSPDGEIFATANDVDTVQLWHARSGREQVVLGEHLGRVRSVAFSPDGRLVATGCDDRVVRLWAAESGALWSSLTGHTDRVYAVAFHPLSDRLVSASLDGTARIWDVATGECLHVLSESGGRLLAVAFSPDGSLLATAGEDALVRLWDPAEGRLRHVLNGHAGRVSAVSFAPSGDLLVSGGDDGGVILWDTAPGSSPVRRATLLGLPDGWAAVTPGGHYKGEGDTAGQFWFVAGPRRFEQGELDPYVPAVLRFAVDTPF